MNIYWTIIYFSTGKEIGGFFDSSKECVDRAVENAKEAFSAWKNLSSFERGKLLRRAADLIRVNWLDSHGPSYNMAGYLSSMLGYELLSTSACSLRNSCMHLTEYFDLSDSLCLYAQNHS